MSIRRALQLAVALCIGAGTAAAQLPSSQISGPVKSGPSLPAGIVPYPDSLILRDFALANGASSVVGGSLSLNHGTIGGVRPTHYRISVYADFRDATWIAYPASGVPNWSSFFDGGGTVANCTGAGRLPVIGHMQLRGLRTNGQYVRSQVSTDTICWLMPG